MYHRFGEDAYPSTSIQLDQFEEHVAKLTSGPYHVLPLSQVVAALREDTPLPAEVALELHRRTEGRFRMAGPDRIVALLPDTQRMKVQLDAAQAALASLVTHL